MLVSRKVDQTSSWKRCPQISSGWDTDIVDDLYGTYLYSFYRKRSWSKVAKYLPNCPVYFRSLFTKYLSKMLEDTLALHEYWKCWLEQYHLSSLDLRKPWLYDPILWMGFNCLKATDSLRGGSLLFTTKSPEIPGTHLINFRRMKGWVDLRVTQWFWTWVPSIGNPVLSSTTRPLLQHKLIFSQILIIESFVNKFYYISITVSVIRSHCHSFSLFKLCYITLKATDCMTWTYIYIHQKIT